MALMGLLLKAGIWIAGLLTRSIPTKAHPLAQPQPEIRRPSPSPPPPDPVEARALPKPAPQPSPAPKLPPAPSSGAHRSARTAAVLNATDHGIWVAGADDFVTRHPRAEELLGQLDKMMFVAAHRDGDPFSIPTLDHSPLATDALPAMRVDDGFDDAPGKPLPAPDGKTWRATAGRAFELMPPSRPRSRKRVMEPSSRAAESPAPLDEDETFLGGHARPLPAPDGEVWLFAGGQPASRLLPRQADRLAHLSPS